MLPGSYGCHGDMRVCAVCSNKVLETEDDVISKAFTGHNGRALLCQNVKNVVLGDEEEVLLATGLHRIANVFCLECGERLGWKYIDTREYSQRYKLGKTILETEQCLKVHSWLEPTPDQEEGKAAEKSAPLG